MRVEVNMVAKGLWTRPQLVVLSRGDPQETVLITCKHSCDKNVGGPDTNYMGCEQSVTCSNCSTLVTTAS
jgi:hypothetical protein